MIPIIQNKTPTMCLLYISSFFIYSKQNSQTYRVGDLEYSNGYWDLYQASISTFPKHILLTPSEDGAKSRSIAYKKKLTVSTTKSVWENALTRFMPLISFDTPWKPEVRM